MVWRWVGHVLRLPPTSLTNQVLTSLQSTASTYRHLRRRRTGPDNSGHRAVLRYLQHRGISLTSASNRDLWRSWEEGWLVHHGIYVGSPSGQNVFSISQHLHLWDRRCLQGSFHGQQVVVCETSMDMGYYLELDRTQGWRLLPGQLGPSTTLPGLLQDIWNTGWLRTSTFHLRILLFQMDGGQHLCQALLGATPFAFTPFREFTLVTELSLLPDAWHSRMKPQLGHIGAADDLGQLPSVERGQRGRCLDQSATLPGPQVIIEMLNAFNAISEDGSLLQMAPWVILYTPFLAKVFAVCPLDWHDWVLVMKFSFPVIILDEVLKFFGRQYQKHKDDPCLKEHARELISAESGLHFVKTVCQQKDALRNNEFMVVVNANPGSRVQVEQGDWCLRVNPNGVDLNRNWDEHWEGDAYYGADTNPGKGPKPFSEAETQLLKRSPGDQRSMVSNGGHWWANALNHGLKNGLEWA
eukprot:Skav231882  [mRNA]  locus=scaffold54:313976:319226:- [translate_table: standard]